MNEFGCGDPQEIEGAAAELFQLASLLVGDESEAVSLVEAAVNASELDPCAESEALRQATRLHVLQGALTRLGEQHPGELAAPLAHAAANSCIDDDDLSASGVSPAQLAAWMAGDGRHDLRQWLEQLPLAQRAVFVQRAVLGQGSDAAAHTLSDAAGPGPAWTPEMVGETFRMALCSLANRVAHSPAAISSVSARAAATAQAV